SLTEQEVKLLKLFVTTRGKPLSRGEILAVGWGYTGSTPTRTVDNFVMRFRKYFEDSPHEPVFFRSLRSVGYVFDHDPEADDPVIAGR
ncbi:MAG: helix-turn-helix domain-containing protein, partial [Syntrophales bacterium LBB04]|nr:helix-turn-helix domain-containing protein [Syntrophales bacterium LBB04]